MELTLESMKAELEGDEEFFVLTFKTVIAKKALSNLLVHTEKNRLQVDVV